MPPEEILQTMETETEVPETVDTETVDTETEATETTETTETVELNIDTDPVFESDSFFDSEELDNWKMEDLYPEEKIDPNKELLEKISQLESKLEKNVQEDKYESEDDPRYKKLELQIEELKQERQKQIELQKRIEHQQRINQVEQVNQKVVETFVKTKINPALKYMGVADQDSISANYARQGIISEFVGLWEKYETEQLKGKVATPKQVEALCKHYWKGFVNRLKTPAAGQKNQANISDRSGVAPTTTQTEMNKLNADAAELAKKIDEIYSKPINERHRYAKDIRELGTKLNEIKQKQNKLKK